MSLSSLIFRGVKGVGEIQIQVTPNKRVYTFIGENGVGKTKFLEAFFQLLITTNNVLTNLSNHYGVNSELWVSRDAEYNNNIVIFPTDFIILKNIWLNQSAISRHNDPVVFLASQNRGFIKHTTQAIPATGSFTERRNNYIQSIFTGMQNDFSNLNMGVDIEQWFIMLAQSSNPYQKQEDNREIEIKTVLKLLHQIDQRIDKNFMEVSGDNRVFLKINHQKIQLSHLSTGFASILKILQSIISGYGYFTNEKNIQHVKGIVLIDEIESHLHIAWQSKIIPLLKTLFPNTTFYITTHSSIVLTQLEAGEAYRLQREKDGKIHSSKITAPNKAAFVDILKNAFDLDINQIKQERMSATEQKEAKQRLLDLMTQQGAKND